MADAVLEGCPRLEIYNSTFTNNFGEWALGFCGDVYNKENPSSLNQNNPLQSVTSLDLSDRCVHSLVNKVSYLLYVLPFVYLSLCWKRKNFSTSSLFLVVIY